MYRKLIWMMFVPIAVSGPQAKHDVYAPVICINSTLELKADLLITPGSYLDGCTVEAHGFNIVIADLPFVETIYINYVTFNLYGGKIVGLRRNESQMLNLLTNKRDRI